MISLKDFASESGVTYEAIRQRVKRYAAELEGHIHQQGRTQYLDDVAVAFLSEHRAPAPMAIYTEDAMVKQIQDLEEELKQAYKEQAEMGRSLAQLSSQNAELTQFKLETMEQRRQLEEHQEEIDDREQNMAQELAEARQEAAEAVKENLDKEWGQKLSEAVKKAKEETESRYRNMGLLEFLRERKKGRT